MTMALVLAAAISGGVNDNWNSHRCATKYLAAVMAAVGPTIIIIGRDIR